MVKMMENLQQEAFHRVAYELTTMEVDGYDDMRYTTYGIQAIDPEGKVIAAYPDVATRRDFVQELVDKCNRGDLSWRHLEDVILDHIG